MAISNPPPLPPYGDPHDVAHSLVGKTIWIRLPNRSDFVNVRVTASPARGLVTIVYYDPDVIDQAYIPGAFDPRGKNITMTVALASVSYVLPRE